MLIEINGVTTELKRETNIQTKLDKIDVMGIDNSRILARVPYKFCPEEHYPLLESIFADYWKKAWDPENMSFEPESGEWEVGISIESLVAKYISYFAETYWGTNEYRYIGCDTGNSAASLETVDVYCSISTNTVMTMLNGSLLDKNLFNELYEAWLEDHQDVDYRGKVDSKSVTRDVMDGIDPEVWGIMLMCSKKLLSEIGDPPRIEKLFTKFLEENKDYVQNSIYTLSPSERKELAELSENA